MVRTYRIVTDEFLIDDAKCENKWNVTSEEKKIGEYNCRKATLDKGGRKWTAWFTTDLPHQAAPRTFAGLPGVVLGRHEQAPRTLSGKIQSFYRNRRLRHRQPDRTLTAILC